MIYWTFRGVVQLLLDRGRAKVIRNGLGGKDLNKSTRLGKLAFHQSRSFLLSLLLVLAAHSGVVHGFGRQWKGEDGQILPFETESEILAFLRTANVVSKKRVGSGVNNPWKVLLEKDGIQAHACFRDVRISKKKAHLKTGGKHNFRDDARFEVAAYRLARMLGIDNIPPVVERKLFRREVTLQIWVENAITEKIRVERESWPSLMKKVQRWQAQNHIMRAFDSLIYNEDRNQGNILYDDDWNLWMIDHTRAFRRHRKLLAPERVWKMEKRFLEQLRNLDPAQVKNALSDYLGPSELRALLARVSKMLEHVDSLVAQKGEERALVELSEGN